jgi:hypothetical protein
MGRKRAIRDFSGELLSVSTGDLARATGLSRNTIRRDIELGELKASRRTPTSDYRIAFDEAERYVRRLCAHANAPNAPNVI